MRKKTTLGILTLFLIILFQYASVKGAYLIIDPTNDVAHYQSAAFVDIGDYHDEIDITKFEITTSQLKLTFEGAPVNSGDHLYQMFVFWDGDSDTLNRTTCLLGTGLNIVTTQLYDSNDLPVYVNSMLDVILVGSHTIEAPIPGYSHVQQLDNPQYVQLHSAYIEILDQNYYTDNHTVDDSTGGTSGIAGLEAGMIILGSAATLFVLIIFRRKK